MTWVSIYIHAALFDIESTNKTPVENTDEEDGEESGEMPPLEEDSNQ